MYERDPNRPERGANACVEKRDLKSDASGNAAQDGYTTVARRPRVPGMTDSVAPEEADRIEGMYRDYPFFGDY